MEKSKKAKDLTKGSSAKTTPQLSEKELDKVAGGFIKLGDIKGESTDDKHKDWIG